jgi:signal transduction histidine kinase
MDNSTATVLTINAETLNQMVTVVHDLCQPLTTLQCRLEMAQMMNTPEDYEEAVALGVTECARMSRHVHALREVLRILGNA